jgi:hypothetical protein
MAKLLKIVKDLGQSNRADVNGASFSSSCGSAEPSES